MESYVSIDIETTGLNPETCQIIEIGAVIDTGVPVEDCPTFHCYVDNGLIQGQPYALSIHPVILRRIATRESGYIYLTPSKVVLKLKEFLRENGVEMPFTAAGKNFAGFDAQFLKKLMHWNKHIYMRLRVLDPATLYWQPEVDGVKLPNTETCMVRAGISGEVAHTAVEDARVVVKLIRYALAKMIV